MASLSTAAALKSVLTFIKSGNVQPACKPGFAHALKLTYNLIAKERLSVSHQNKTLAYRYQWSKDVPKPTLGLYTALMDELSTNACFAAGLPSAPGVSLQMQTEILSRNVAPDDGIDIVNSVTKLGRTVAHLRTDFYCSTTQQPLAFSSHVKYLPTGNPFLDFLFRNKRAYRLFERLYLERQADPTVYPEKNLFTEVIGGHLEYSPKEQKGSFQVTLEHTQGFGSMHGGCHAMVMEQAGVAHAKTELQDDNLLLEGIQIEFMAAVSRGTVDILCETIGRFDDILHVRVLLKQGERICSEGMLRFSKKKN